MVDVPISFAFSKNFLNSGFSSIVDFLDSSFCLVESDVVPCSVFALGTAGAFALFDVVEDDDPAETLVFPVFDVKVCGSVVVFSLVPAPTG